MLQNDIRTFVVVYRINFNVPCLRRIIIKSIDRVMRPYTFLLKYQRQGEPEKKGKATKMTTKIDIFFPFSFLRTAFDALCVVYLLLDRPCPFHYTKILYVYGIQQSCCGPLSDRTHGLYYNSSRQRTLYQVCIKDFFTNCIMKDMKTSVACYFWRRNGGDGSSNASCGMNSGRNMILSLVTIVTFAVVVALALALQRVVVAACRTIFRIKIHATFNQWRKFSSSYLSAGGLIYILMCGPIWIFDLD